ncbi:O-antigen ligase family protein [Devosia nitrariae]|uniref:O-antigen ligase family protein n=1 Tax=Devosia nitrariae TaxID=2071872 RepID=UPI0024E13B51|nr:O-antigen ligase family protein [Devosia nitrariae]
MQTARLLPPLAAVALLVGLVLPTVLPEAANVSFFVVAGLAILLLARSTAWGSMLRRPGIAMPLLGGAILTVCFAITAREPSHVLTVAYFMPLFLAAPLAGLFARVPGLMTPQAIGLAATAGAAGAAAVALFDALVLGLPRAGVSVNNPIHFADLALTLGFVALVGVYSDRRWVRLLVIAAPACAFVAVLLSGSRGPTVAFVPMLTVALLVLLAHEGWGRGKWLTLVVAAVVGLALAVLAWKLGAFAEVTAFADIIKVLRSETVDGSTAKRLVMYWGAFEAFLSSPVFGHGLVDLTEAVARHVPPDAPFESPPHMHNDIADFAVVGGTLGLFAYGLFLLAPLAEAISAGRPRPWPAIYLASVLCVGYLSMGMTNAMLGILSQTVLYGFCLALVVHLASPHAAAAKVEPAR